MKTACISSGKKFITYCIILTFLLITGCSSTQQSTTIYPRKPENSEGRKAGRAMLLYEQAEKDMDVNDSVIVIPPEEKEDTAEKPKEE